MAYYRKKPVVIEARQFETNNENGSPHMDALCNWANQGKGDSAPLFHDGTNVYIRTLEGTMKADVKDWVIRGVKGEFYPCKPDIFDATYELAE